jgi:ribosome-binding protein aMBF1 (putative translation factor)
MTKCDFCGKEGNWINVLRSTEIVKKDGSDLILCDDCLNHYANGEYDKIKLKKN